MNLFQSTQDWSKSELCKRIFIACKEELTQEALDFCFEPNKLTEFDSLFCLDINRDSSINSLKVMDGYESFIFQPKSWEELVQSVHEVSEYTQIKKQEGLFAKTTLVLNNWQTASYLFTASEGGIGNINPVELLIQLKFLSDNSNIILLSSQNYSNNLASNFGAKHKNQSSLSMWSHLSMDMVDGNTLKISKSAFPDWSIGDKIMLKSKTKIKNEFLERLKNEAAEDNEENQEAITHEEEKYSVSSVQTLNTKSLNLKSKKQNKKSNPKSSANTLEPVSKTTSSLVEVGNESDDDSQPIKSQEYDNLVAKLSSAENREQLLEARKEIQALSEVLTGAEKVALSDIYKIHLNRIKLVADAALEAS